MPSATPDFAFLSHPPGKGASLLRNGRFSDEGSKCPRGAQNGPRCDQPHVTQCAHTVSVISTKAMVMSASGATTCGLHGNSVLSLQFLCKSERKVYLKAKSSGL